MGIFAEKDMDVNVDTIIARLHTLEKENARLKSLLEEHGIPYEVEKQLSKLFFFNHFNFFFF